VLAVVVRGVGAERVEQGLGGEDVVPHRGERLVGAVGQPRWVGGLLQERLDPPSVGRRLDHAERRGLLPGDRDAGDGDPGPAVEVLLPHLLGVHPVDVVGAEHDDHVGAVVVDEVPRLEDRVRRPGVPARAEALLSRDRRDVVAEQRAHPPGGGDVTVQTVALVLGQDGDVQDAGVDQVRQGEVDQPVEPGERDRGFGPVGGERSQPLALTTGEDDPHHLGVGHVFPPHPRRSGYV
jgi:hypothetical protein